MQAAPRRFVRSAAFVWIGRWYFVSSKKALFRETAGVKWRVIFGLALLLAGVGCTTVQRESLRAQNVVVSTGEGIESGVHVATRKARSWWSRLFDRDGSAGERTQRRSSAGAASSNGRYETLAPQYVGTDDAVDAR